MRSGALEESDDGMEYKEWGEEEVVEGGPKRVPDALAQLYAAELVAELNGRNSEAPDEGDRNDIADVGGVDRKAETALTQVVFMALFVQFFSGPLPSTSGSGSTQTGAVVLAVKRPVLLHTLMSSARHLAEAKKATPTRDRHRTLGATTKRSHTILVFKGDYRSSSCESGRCYKGAHRARRRISGAILVRFS